MTDRAAFLRAIAAAAWDDELPRLVYADWLDEHDEPEEADRQRKWVPAVRWLREYAVKHKPYDVACVTCYGSGKDYFAPGRRPGEDPPACPACGGTGESSSPDPAGEAYEALLREWLEGTVFYHGTDLHDRSELADEAELRHHMAVVTGRPVSDGEFATFTFTCSC